MTKFPRILSGAITIGLLTTLISIAYALFAEPDRASAVGGALSSGGMLIVAAAALFISHQTLERLEEQVDEGRSALELSHKPVVVPIHDVGKPPAVSSLLSEHPPAKERYALNVIQRPHYAFTRSSDGACSLYLQNIGTGPALGINAHLESPDGLFAESRSMTSLMAGSLTQLTLKLLVPQTRMHPPPEDDGYVLRLEYSDIFGRPHVIRACFLTDGTGSWVIDAGTDMFSKPHAVKRNA